MLNLSFHEFMIGDYPDQDLHLYVVRTYNEVLYVGISTSNIWNRWFSARNAHMVQVVGSSWIGNSAIGQAVCENMPESLEWTIELWSLEDCAGFLDDKMFSKGRLNIRDVEPLMIQKLLPKLNVIYNAPRSNRE